MLDLRHECGGIWVQFSSGHVSQTFRCDKCGEFMEWAFTQEDQDRRSAAMEAMRARVAAQVASAPPMRMPTGRMLTVDEAHLLAQYSDWSEDNYAAGFMDPTASTVAEFIRAQEEEPEGRRAWDYEEEFLDEFQRQGGRKEVQGGGNEAG